MLLLRLVLIIQRNSVSYHARMHTHSNNEFPTKAHVSNSTHNLTDLMYIKQSTIFSGMSCLKCLRFGYQIASPW